MVKITSVAQVATTGRQRTGLSESIQHAVCQQIEQAKDEAADVSSASTI
jgi:hypothetical protein